MNFDTYENNQFNNHFEEHCNRLDWFGGFLASHGESGEYHMQAWVSSHHTITTEYGFPGGYAHIEGGEDKIETVLNEYEEDGDIQKLHTVMVGLAFKVWEN